MSEKIDVAMPPLLDLPAGWAIRVTAVDASGATVTAVNVSDMGIIADAPLGVDDSLNVGPFMLVPGPGA